MKRLKYQSISCARLPIRTITLPLLQIETPLAPGILKRGISRRQIFLEVPVVVFWRSMHLANYISTAVNSESFQPVTCFVFLLRGDTLQFDDLGLDRGGFFFFFFFDKITVERCRRRPVLLRGPTWELAL